MDEIPNFSVLLGMLIMKRGLTLIAILVCVYFVFFMNAVMVLFNGISDDILNHWMGESGLKLMMFSIILVVPAHLVVILAAIKKNQIDWTVGLAYFLIPYMLGASVQTIVL